jgi:hypothetical protein
MTVWDLEKLIANSYCSYPRASPIKPLPFLGEIMSGERNGPDVLEGYIINVEVYVEEEVSLNLIGIRYQESVS